MTERFAEPTQQGTGKSSAVAHSIGALVYEQVYSITQGRVIL
jgi:hypothetical protein